MSPNCDETSEQHNEAESSETKKNKTIDNEINNSILSSSDLALSLPRLHQNNENVLETTTTADQLQHSSAVQFLQQFPISKLKTNTTTKATIDDDNNVNNDDININCNDDINNDNINDDNNHDINSMSIVNRKDLNSPLHQQLTSSSHQSESKHSSNDKIKIDKNKIQTFLSLEQQSESSNIKEEHFHQITNKSPSSSVPPPPSLIEQKSFHSNQHESLLHSIRGQQENCDNLLASVSSLSTMTTSMKPITKNIPSVSLQIQSSPFKKESSASPPLPPRSIITLSSNNSITGMSQCIKNIESNGNGGNNLNKNSSNRNNNNNNNNNNSNKIGGDISSNTIKNNDDLILTYDNDDDYHNSQPSKSIISGLEACVKQLKNESMNRTKQTFEPFRNSRNSSNSSSNEILPLPSNTNLFQHTTISTTATTTSTASIHSNMPARTTRSSSRLAAQVATAAIAALSSSNSGAITCDSKSALHRNRFNSESFTNNSKMKQFSMNRFDEDFKALQGLSEMEKRLRRHERGFQKLTNDSELASPRCQSRESSGSGGRCPSDDSNCSGNGSTSAGPTPTSPVGITLPATLPPSAAAALLPPQSAAMAAYLNVAAAAAQQNRLLLSNPLAAAAAGLVQAAQSPPNLPLASPMHPDDTSILDFSTKRIRKDSDTDSKSDSDAVNLSKSDNGESGGGGCGGGGLEYIPLDLSVGNKKRTSEPPESPTLQRKMARHNQTTPSPNQVPTSWVAPINPYLAAVAAASLSPKNHLDWNGKSKISNVAPNDAAKALEKMSEMTRLGGPPDNDVPMRLPNNQVNNNTTNSSNTGSTGRHSAWQSHWLNKGADAAKDVFKCVWCKQSFPTLATLTTHMKETQHCGVNVPPSGNLPSQQGNSGGPNQQQQHHHHHQSTQNSSSNSSNSSKSDLNLLIKETMPLPRKLVRGQDVWLGKGAEQTRQILKCMWCGQSFRSLAEMTEHMQQTQHYTNIISQEQIISWKSSEEKGGGGGGGNNGGQTPNANSNANSTVSAVLTCKVCDQAFSSLKDLSNHMVKNAHYKEHIMRSITESGGRRRQTREKRKKSLPVRKLLELERAQHDFKNGDIKGMRPTVGDLGASTRITCEKCGDKIETALFVEHIRLCVGGQIANNTPRNNLMNKPLSVNSIIPPDSMSPLTPTSSRDGRKSIGGCDDSATSPASSNRHISPHAPDLSSPISSKDGNIGGGGGGGCGSIGGNSSGGEKSSPSVLNAIEQLIEKSFDTRSRHNTPGFSANSHTSAPLGSSILKRLGIDESVDYTKPLIDPQTMSLLRSYQNSQNSRRERSGSESSSVSDRGSSRLESLTPERKPDIMFSNNTSPRESPDKATNYSHSEHEDEHNNKDNSSSIKVKSEPLDGENDEDTACNNNNNNNINNCNENKNENDNNHDLNKEIKKEIVNLDDNDGDHMDDNNKLDLSSPLKHQKSNTPSTSAAPSPIQPISHSFPPNSSHIGGGGGAMTPAASPCSDRSTPRSTANSINNDTKKLSVSGSLNALSSMFDNLTGTGSLGGGGNDTNNGCGTNKKTTSHPLAALQKLCDKTETTSNTRSGSNSGALSSSLPSIGGSSPGNILAFSWACNDAVITQDSIIKCTLCDTPFCSKGAYRHHLSKVHFVKDDYVDPMTLAKSSSSSASSAGSGGSSEHNRSASVSSNKSLPHSRSQSPKIPIGYNNNNNNNNNNNMRDNSNNNHSMSAVTAKSPSPSTSTSTMNAPHSQQSQHNQPPAASQSPFDESPHSKFLKYTELAKQLSSKYV